ncbi:MAG: hypothetical protein IJU57_05805 [Clostridia bacterium]|nr:hypothetical protein [Clostridia bacterium]
MPYIDLKTNTEVTKSTENILKSELAAALESSFPGKTEKWLMVNIEGYCTMYFAGSDQKCAMVSIDILGSQPDSGYEKMTEKVCGIVSDQLKIDPDRIYVKYSEYEKWGWNGSNF